MTGNWSISKEELEDDIMPDFCCGFSYITTPEVYSNLIVLNVVFPNFRLASNW